MQLYAVNPIPLLGSLYMFRVFYKPIIRSNSVALVRKRTISTERPPVGEVSANFLRIEGCHVVSATDLHGR